MQNKNRNILFWFLAIFTLALTGLFALADCYEYYKVAIKKDIEGYRFGAEGPVAGIEHYKTAELYARHVLTYGIIGLVLFGLAIYFTVKRKTIGLLMIISVLILYMLFNVMREIYR